MEMNGRNSYQATLDLIRDYFGVSDTCASYLYHRSFRSKRKDDKYMLWNVKLQNALIKADKCLGLDWTALQFGQEYEELAKHGILVDEMEDSVFKWDVPFDGWTVVSNKKAKKKINLGLIRRPGLYI